MISFSIIIPTCHRNDDLKRCLRILRMEGTAEIFSKARAESEAVEQHYRYEVIVTDDGIKSTAEESIAEAFPGGIWVKGPGRGPAANRNHGAGLAKGDWLVFLDDDCIPGASWLEAYAAAIAESPQCHVFEGRTVPQGTKRRADQECPINLEGGNLWSCNFSIKRSLFLEIGGFDEDFPFSLEDIDFQRRITLGGHPIKFVPNALVQHPWRLHRGTAFCTDLAKSIAYFTVKHPTTKRNFSETWGIKRMIRIVLYEFPRNLFRFRNSSAFRVLYLDLVTAVRITRTLSRTHV